MKQIALPPAAVPAAARAYCRSMLPEVSRTFALNIRLLPSALGDAVLLAYLLCRIADTVEDSELLAPDRKPSILAEYSSLFPLGEDWEARVRRWSAHFAALETLAPDHRLCRDAPVVFSAFAALPAAWRAPVEACVQEMAAGMSTFAARRVAAPDGRLRLETMAELEEYCHYVAGTVGSMLCRLFAAASPRLDARRLERMQRLAERFGLALQLTNIIKDMADDMRRGACYVPRTLVERHRMAPDDLLDPERRPAARAVLRELVGRAALALDAAMAFTLLIPRREPRLRLFCLWPIFLAVRTLLVVIDDERLFLPGARLRIGRAEVRRCLGCTALSVLSNRAIRHLYARERLALDAACSPG